MRAESEVRREAVVLGPGKPGFLRVSLGRRRYCRDERIVEVGFERIPERLRLPNTRLVAVTSPDGVLRVEEEAAGRPRLDLEERVRHVLNEWDPIGVADEVDDEYDGYIGAVLGLLRSGASEPAIADHLRTIERERMELQGTPMDHLLLIATRLRGLQSPEDAARRHS